MNLEDAVTGSISVADAERAVILLHGRGATASSILPLANKVPGVAVIAPQAPNNTWYPQSFLKPRAENQPALSTALDRVADTLNVVTDHVPQENVVLAGFSQGACLATTFAAEHPGRYLAVYGFSGGIIGEQIPVYEGDMEETPVVLSCSSNDPYIPKERVEETAAVFTAMNADVETRLRPGRDHTIPENDAQRFRELLSN